MKTYGEMEVKFHA